MPEILRDLQYNSNEDLIRLFHEDKKFFIETFITISDKSRKLIPFMLNDAQNLFYKTYKECKEKKIHEHIILKSRQMGFTTFICALFLSEAILVPNTTAVIIAHDRESTERIFEKTKQMYELLPDQIRPVYKYASRREIGFEEINSKIFIGTAGTESFGRGTTVNLLHCSEFAFWDNPRNVLASLLETAPKDASIIYETTPNGYNHFYKMYTEAKETSDKNRAINKVPYPHFYEWFKHKEYKNSLDAEEVEYIQASITPEEEALMKIHSVDHEQIAWRRSKIARLKDLFPQEYPEDDASCFLSSGRPFFSRDKIKAIKNWISENKVSEWMKTEMEYIKVYKQYEPNPNLRYTIAVDPAEGNPASDDSSAVVLCMHRDPFRIEQCAEISDKIQMPKFYRLVHHLGALYKFPVLAIERNNHGHLLNFWATNGLFQNGIKILDKYPNVYVANDKKPGFYTSIATRPLILDNLAELLSNDMFVIYSSKWLNQALSFVYSSKGKPEAESGENDDAILSMAIGAFLLTHTRNSSGFSFLNKDSFGMSSQTTNKPKIYEKNMLIYNENAMANTEDNIQYTLPGTAQVINMGQFFSNFNGVGNE